VHEGRRDRRAERAPLTVILGRSATESRGPQGREACAERALLRRGVLGSPFGRPRMTGEREVTMRSAPSPSNLRQPAAFIASPICLSPASMKAA
jgi:hypothetical protein